MRSSYFHRWIRKDSKNNVRYEEQQYRGETTKATDRLDMARKENTHILIFFSYAYSQSLSLSYTLTVRHFDLCLTENPTDEWREG